MSQSDYNRVTELLIRVKKLEEALERITLEWMDFKNAQAGRPKLGRPPHKPRIESIEAE